MAAKKAQLSATQVKDAERTFESFVKDRESHEMKVSDVGQAMKTALGHGVKPEWLEKMEDIIDDLTDGSGYLTWENFKEVLERKLQDDEEERELRDIFRVLDRQRKGEVNVNDLRWILKELGDDLTEEDIDDMIADVDTDGSGWVDYEEFSHLMLG